jgi:hypothetical protein
MAVVAVLLGIAGFILIWTVRRQSRVGIWLSIAGVCGILVHGSLVLTAITGVSDSRYTLGLWAPMSLGIWALLVAVFIRLAPWIMQWRVAGNSAAKEVIIENRIEAR